MRPLIGIAPSLDVRGQWREGRSTHYLDAAYAAAVAEAGGTPLLLPHSADPAELGARLDGLLLPGGGDFLPLAPYRAEVAFDPVPEAQLAFDRTLLAAALERGRPVLGICYGMQLLVLEAGGRLYHDIACELPGAGEHRLPEPAGRHALHLEPGTRLRALLGADQVAVNSRHHQAVAEPGPRLRVSARAADGVIEAVEAPAGPFCLGVQWHPEHLEPEHRRRLFGALVESCGSGGA